jgi:hypothetical protein
MASHTVKRGQERPLIRKGPEVVIHKHTVVAVSGLPLQGQCDQIAKPALGQRVLVRKQPVIGTQSQLGPALHRLRQEQRAKLSSRDRRHRFRKKEPDVASVAGAGSFQRDGHRQVAAGLDKCGRIRAPAIPIEIHRQKMAGLVAKHRIDPHHEVVPRTVATGQMPADHFVAYREKALIGAIGTFDARFLAHAADPFVAASGLIPRPSRPPALESARIHLVAPPKQRTEQGDFGRGR